MTTPNMNLTLPVVSQTLGPTWASQLNTALTTVDSHNHTFGNGAPVPSAGIDINADLPFGGYNATQLASTQFVDQTSYLAAALGLYSLNGDLFYSNLSSTPVQITSGSSIVGAGGTITGLPSALKPTAGVSFNGSTGLFTFVQATNSAAPLDIGPLTLRTTSVGSGGITVTPPAGTTSYTLTLPGSPPASAQSLLGISTGGTLSNVAPDATMTVTSSSFGVATGGIQTANIANGAVTASKLAALGQAFSVSSGNSTQPLVPTFTQVTNLTLLYSVSTTRPLMLFLQNDGNATNPSFVYAGGSTGDFCIQAVGPSGTDIVALTRIAASLAFPPSSIQTLYVPPSTGLYTFSVLAKNNGGGSIVAQYVKLVVVPQ